MNPENICISIENAKKLKELGVKQESYFYHYNEPYDNDGDCWMITNIEDYETAYSNKGEPYSAYTAEELSSFLPDNLCLEDEHPNLFMAKGTRAANQWTIGYSTFERSVSKYFTESSMANAFAKLLIHLIEEGLLNNDI
jgi:hypothetical protein